MKRQFDTKSECLTLSDNTQTVNSSNSANATAMPHEMPDAYNETVATRLGKCEVCAAKEARYACPKCEVKTCCLRCVQIHKKELKCDGIRDRTKFIPLRKMSKMDFMSDYYFLEECTRYTEDRKFDRIKRVTRFNKDLPLHLHRLRCAATDRKTQLHFLLPNFTAHKENTTYYNWKQRKLFWRIEWTFLNACGIKYIDERCDESETLQVLLSKYVDATNAVALTQHKALAYYQSVGVFGLTVLLKAERVKRSNMRYYKLDVSKSLQSNLMNRTIVEYPHILVSYENKLDGFEIIDSDDDIENETKTHMAALDSLRQQNSKMNGLSNVKEDEQLSAASDEELDKPTTSVASKKLQAVKKVRAEDVNFIKKNNFLFPDEAILDMLSSDDESASESVENDIPDDDDNDKK